jgi:adenosylhomocysteine nucleosidase
MSDLVFEDPCVVFALGREAGPFLNEFRPHQRFPGAPCWASFSGPAWLTVLVLETGMGEAAAARAAEWLLDVPRLGDVPCRPKAVLSAGFSGALTDSLQTGDVVLATEVVDADGGRWPATWPEELPAGEWRPPLHRHPVLAVPRLVGTPDEKRALGEQTGAAAVDMESAAWARLCAGRGVPFGCVRVILDDLRTPLSPRLLTLLSDGRVAPLRVLAAVARSPGLVRELWQLAGKSRHAAGQLGKALGELLTITLPWAEE